MPATYSRPATAALGLRWLKAIDKVNAGEIWFERATAARALGEMSRVNDAKGADVEAAKIATLSQRELEVVDLIGEGLKNKQIAERLFVSETTVQHHLSSIFAKLAVSDRLELVISGWDFWTNEIASCGTNAACIESKRINVSAAYFLSIEFQQTGYLVERMYKAAYGDANRTSTIGGAHQLPVPIVRFKEFLLDTQEIGLGVVVLQTGWEQVLENNKQAFALRFVQRSRFATAWPTTMTPTGFVNQLFANARVTPTATARNAAIAEFGSATNTTDVAARSRALRDVAENSTLTSQEFNRAFVLMQFFSYLRRNPNDPQDIDYTGYEFWLNKLNFFNGNYNQAEMVKAFIVSVEYRSRFGP